MSKMIKDTPPMSTAIYVRVSTEEQAKEGFSIRAQIEKLKSYIQIKDWHFYKVYIDEGISGKNITARPAINELLEDIKATKVNNVLVYKIDRLTRSIRDLLDLIEFFNEHNCSFNSLTESIDTQSSTGRFFLKILGIFAEFERDAIAERVTFGRVKKVNEGYTLGTFISSYGYRLETGNRVQKIIPEEARIVREIYAMYVDNGLSYQAIARNLNHRGIKPKKGGTWNHSSIKNILMNPNYIGLVRYGTNDKAKYFEVEGKHEAIISQELFDEAQSKMGKITRKSYTKRPKEDNYFSGTLYCAECDTKLGTHNQYRINKKGEKKSNGAYRCPNVLKGLCDTSTVSHNKVKQAFEAYMDNIEDITVTDEILSEEQAREQSKQEDIKALLREEYETSIKRLEKKAKDLMKLYIDERITFEEYEQMIKIVTNDKNTYLAQLASLPDEPTEEAHIIITDIVTNFRENWQLLTKAEKMQFVQNYIEKISVVSKKDDGHQVQILKMKFYS